MRIDPKTYTFDALERSTLLESMRLHKGKLLRNINEWKKSRAAGTDKAIKRVNQLETELARIDDLLSRLA